MKFSNLFTSDDSSEFVEVGLELEFELNAHRLEQQEADSDSWLPTQAASPCPAVAAESGTGCP